MAWNFVMPGGFYECAVTSGETLSSGGQPMATTPITGQSPGSSHHLGAAIDPAEARELLITALRNAHGLEQQAIEMLERNVERLEHYDQLRSRLARHLEESREQQAMVAQALSQLGASPSTIKDTVMGFTQNVQAMMHAAADDEVLKNSMTGYAFEHFEIASYTALAVMADAAGEPQIATLARQICRQEQDMADWLFEHLPDVVQEHLLLRPTGEHKH
jgi:ferritin-like metal-binding protein YciE